MQVSTDATARFISAVAGQSNERDWYRVSVADDKNEVITFYCTAMAYGILSHCNFGDSVDLVFNASQGRSGLYMTCVDVVTNG